MVLNLTKCLFFYFLIIIMMYHTSESGDIVKFKKNTTCVDTCWSFLFSVLFGLYNYFIIGFKEESYHGGDRGNYYAAFTWRKTNYFLFDKYYEILKRITDNFPLVLAITTFLSCFIAITALRKSKYYCKETILCFLLSYFVFTSLITQRQIFADAFAGLFFVLFIEYRKKVPQLLYIILIVCACGFHSTGYILIPLFFLLRIKINETKLWGFVLALFVGIVFMKPVLDTISSLLINILPILSNKIIDYNGDVVETVNSPIIIAAKGFPYYFLVIEGIIRRKEGKKIYDHYDSYLIISIIAGFITLASAISYWYQRFTLFFIIPICLFCPMVIHSTKDKKERLFVRLIIIGGMAIVTFRTVFLVYIKYGGY